jgi:hypothetical protein
VFPFHIYPLVSSSSIDNPIGEDMKGRNEMALMIKFKNSTRIEVGFKFYKSSAYGRYRVVRN